MYIAANPNALITNMPKNIKKMIKNIKDFNIEELKQELVNLGEKPFRAEQIFKWIFMYIFEKL